MSKIYFIDIFKRPQIEHNTRQLLFDVFMSEFPICDVAQGLIGIPLFFQKGIPLSGSVIVQRKRLYVYSLQNNLRYLTFLHNLI